METRKCPRSLEEKPIAAFRVKRVYADRVLWQAYCIPCSRQYHREHYRANKASYYRHNDEREQRIREMVEKAKARPCADCGVEYPPWVMDFDHVRGNKVMTLANLVAWRPSVRRVLAEIAKCEVVCANCHRDRTHRRRMAQKTVG